MDKIQQIADLEITRYEAVFINTSLLIGIFYACDPDDTPEYKLMKFKIETYIDDLKLLRKVVNPARISLIRRALETLY